MRRSVHDEVPEDAPVGLDHYGLEYAARLLLTWLEAHKEATERGVLDALGRFRELRCSEEQGRAVIAYGLAAGLFHTEEQHSGGFAEAFLVYCPGPAAIVMGVDFSASGRASWSSKPNVQNIPRPGPGKSGA